MTRAIDRVRQALNVTGQEPHFMARCPGHPDNNPSLSVSDGQDRVLLKCFAGCDQEAIVKGMGLTFAQLYDKAPPGIAGARVVNEYPYTTANDDLVGLARRGDPKTFRPLSMVDGKWSNTANPELRSTPYRLPELVAAVARGETVYVVEGERDADSLAAVGHAATTNQGGAGSWTPDHARWLTGADVVVIRDRDAGAGARHAQTVGETLAEVGATFRIMEAAEGKDVTDHLSAGLTLDQLLDVTDQFNPLNSGQGDRATNIEHNEQNNNSLSGMNGRRLLTVTADTIKPKRLKWLWSDRIPLGTLSLLAGREGLGKSTLAVDLAARVTMGELPGEFYGVPRSVVYVASEDAKEFTVVPRMIAAGADLKRIHFINVDAPDGYNQLVLPVDTDALAHVIRENDVGLVVLDAATSVIDGRLDGNADRKMRQALEPISRLADETDSAVLGIVHFSAKKSTADTGDAIMGTSAWSQVTRSVLAVAKDEDSGNLILSNAKANLAPMETPSLSFSLTSFDVPIEDGSTTPVGRLNWLGETDVSATSLLLSEDERIDRQERTSTQKWLVDFLSEHGGRYPAGDVYKAAKNDGISEATLRRARGKLNIELDRNGGFGGGGDWVLPDHLRSDHTDHSDHSDQPRKSEQGVSGTDRVCDRCGVNPPINQYVSHCWDCNNV